MFAQRREKKSLNHWSLPADKKRGIAIASCIASISRWNTRSLYTRTQAKARNICRGTRKILRVFSRKNMWRIYSGESSLKSRGALTYFLSPAKKKSSESWLEKKKEKKKGKRGKRRSRNEWKRCERSNFEVVLAGQGGEGKIVDIVDPTGTRYSKTAEEFEFFFQKQVKFQWESHTVIDKWKVSLVFLQRQKLITNIVFFFFSINSILSAPLPPRCFVNLTRYAIIFQNVSLHVSLI